MGYSHNFFALDVGKLKGIFGSKNDELMNQILKEQQEDINDNDAFFEDEIELGEVPNTSTAIRQIFDGNPQMDAEGAIYGYALKIICQHLGEPVWGGEYGVADVTDHPYKSNLLKSGIPIPIPEPSDFPMIGHLSLDQIDDEIELATGKHEKTASDSAEALSALRSAFGLRRGEINAEEIQEDIDAYVETLQKAKQLAMGLVSFRH